MTGLFSDDFPGTALDLTKWRPCRSRTGPDGAYNADIEGAYFRRENVTVNGGVLSLTIRDDPGTVWGVSYPWSSGSVSTEDSFTFGPNTYVEARIRIPKSDGLWPAFWACTPGRWPPEIDIFEFFDTAKQGRPRFNYHPAAGGQTGPREYGTGDCRGTWHTYGLLRTSTSLTPYLDGQAYPGVPVQDDLPYFLILNLSAYRGHAPRMGAHMDVAWVRARSALT